MDPLALLARDDKWFLGGGKGAIYAPPFPKHIDSFGYWDEAYLADVRLQRIFTSLFLDARGRPLRFTAEQKGWRPDRLELVHRAPGVVVREIRCVLECNAWVSELYLEEAPGELDVFLWSLQDLRPIDYGTPWSSLVDCSVTPDSQLFRFDTAWPTELEPDRTAVEVERVVGSGAAMLPPLPLFVALGADRPRVSQTVNLAQRHDDSPLWETSVLPEKFVDGRLPGDFKLRVGPGEPEGLVHLVQHYRLGVGERVQFVAAAGLSPAAARDSLSSALSGRACDESERAWRRYFSGVPQFSSSDPWLTAAYWYRWYGLRLNTVDMPDLPICGSGLRARIADQGLETAGTHGLEGHGTEKPLIIRQGSYLPHWTLEGGTYAVRFRLADAVPSHTREEWRLEREHLEKLGRKGELTPAQRVERHRLFDEKVDTFLDAGSGSCVLKDHRAASIMRDSLAFFDGQRYETHAWCVMPNHVHVVLKPLPGNKLADILHSWKSYSSNQINKALGLQGNLWLEESYDHLIRDADDYDNQCAYILDNPAKAALTFWPWVGRGFGERATGFQPVSDLAFQAELPEQGLEAPGTHGQDGHGTVGATGFQPVSGLAFQAKHPEQGLETPGTHGQDGHGTFSPFVTEGIGFFRNFVTYSAQAHLREVAWMHDPRLAVGILENLAKCQRADGSFPGHNYSCRPARDFYHAGFAPGLHTLQALHGKDTVSERSWNAFERYLDYFLEYRMRVFEIPNGKFSTTIPDSAYKPPILFLIFDQNETGQEYMSRYTAVQPDADQWSELRVCGVDASVYVQDLLAACAFRDEPRPSSRRFSDLHHQVRDGLTYLAFDEESKLFRDVLLDGSRSPATPATGLYPVGGSTSYLMWHNDGRDLHGCLQDWLFTQGRFQHPGGFSADSATDPSFSASAEWKNKRLNCPWNGRSWPMVNSHLVDAAADFVRAFEGDVRPMRLPTGELRPSSAESEAKDLKHEAGKVLMKSIKLMFHDGDPGRPNSFEHYNPVTGMPALYRGYDDYMHSWIVDLIMRHAVGVQPGQDTVDPLPLEVEWIECTDIPHPHGRMNVRLERGREALVEIV